MDAFSSSFVAAFCQPKLIFSTTTQTTSSPHIPLFHISSIQDKKSTSPPSNPKPQTPLYSPKPTASNTNITTTKEPLSQPNNSTKSSPTVARKRAEPSLSATIFNTFDDIINNFIDPPLRPSVDPRYVLSNNFAPVDELPPTDCPIIKGKLPPCLDGAYIRNGSNPQFLPRGPYHLFDGDGMLHSLRISQGRATLCSRYVKTYKYNLESNAGSPLLPNVFSGFNGLPAVFSRGALSVARVFAGQFNPINGIGHANTSLSFFANSLFAHDESDLPYSIRLTPDGDIETIGRHDFDGKLFKSMTAHPKVDADTGEVFAFRYGLQPPFLTFFRFDPNGSKQPDVPIFSIAKPTLFHDFAVTKKYAIFSDIQIGMNPMETIITSGSLVGADPGKVPRIGVIPRYAKDESQMKWFHVPGLNILHAINAWDEGEDNIVLIAPNILSVEHFLERLDLVHASVEKVKINLKTGIVSRYPLSATNLELGVINPAFVGKKNKYGYASVVDRMPKISGVVKLDWSEKEGKEHKDRTVACRMFGAGCYGGEPFYVATEPENAEAEEDDGYVVTYVHDENTGESKFLVMDAKSPTLDIVAAVKLPRRVPYGFHGLFVRDSDLKKLAVKVN